MTTAYARSFADYAMICLAGALIFSAPISARAEGLYLKLLGGFSAAQNSTATLSGGGSSRASYDTGFGAAASIGYAFTPNLAVEAEYMYRSSDTSSFRAGGFGTSGDFASVIISANAIYTFDGWDVSAGRIRPYVGAGIGVIQEVDMDISGGAAAGEYSDSGSIAFQGLVGLAWDVSDSWRLSLEGRYMTAGMQNLDRSGGPGVLSARYETFDALAGVSYRF